MSYVGMVRSDPALTRRRLQEECMICLQNEYRRGGGTNTNQRNGGDSAGDLDGAWGRIVAAEIAGRCDGGNRDSDPNSQTGASKGERHKVLENVADLTFNLMERVVDATAIIHKGRLLISGPLADAEEWHRARTLTNIDAALPTKLRYALATGAVGLKPRLEKGYHPGVCVIPAHQLDAIPFPGDPLKPMVVFQYAPDRCYVSDLSDPRNPVYSVWLKREHWEKWRSGKRSAAKPLEHLEGDDYPWYYQGEAIHPVTIYRGNPKSDTLLPVASGLLQDTKDLILKRALIEWNKYAGMFDRALIMTDSPIQGADLASLDPSVILNIWSQGGKSVEIIPNSTEAVERLWGMWQDAAALAANRYHRDLVLKRSDSQAARSGLAIMLESMGLYQFREEQANLHRPLDEAMIKSVVATWNYMTAIGWLDEESIPELDFAVDYELKWSAMDKAEKRKSIKADIDAGLCSPVELWLFDRDLPPTEENIEAAMAALTEVGRRRKVLAQAGLMVGAEGLGRDAGQEG